MPQLDDRVDPADEPAQVVLNILTGHYPALLAMDELIRECVSDSRDTAKTAAFVTDGVIDLQARGLAHRLDNFVFASRAAVAAEALQR